jgi:hypothetical protein
MFASLKTSIAASLTALTIGLALSASPADAGGFRMGGGHGGFGGFHGPGGFHGRGFHRTGWGWRRHGWGPGFGVGFIAAGAACIVYQPSYDDAGNYLGQYPVNVCQ